MKLALISLSKDSPDESGPIGLLPLFDGYILDQQIRALQEVGAEKIILISPTMHSALLRYVDSKKNLGLDIEIVRSGHDLLQFASDKNEIFYLADGILLGGETVGKMANAEDETLFVTKDSPRASDFERIDRSDRWLGFARLKASRLSGFIDLPEDWDVGSALLRGAVQSRCRRAMIDEEALSDGAIEMLGSEIAVEQYVKNRLNRWSKRDENFLERLAIWPFTRVALPGLWRVPRTPYYLGIAAIVIGLIAFAMSLVELPVFMSLFSLCIVSILIYIRKKSRLFSAQGPILDWVSATGNLIIVVVTGHLIVRESIAVTMPANLVIFGLGLGIILLSDQPHVRNKWNWIKLDITLALLILSAFSIFGNLMAGIYSVASMGMIYLLAHPFGKTKI